MDDLEEWKQAASVEAGLRRELKVENERLRKALYEIIALDHNNHGDGASRATVIARNAVHR